MNNRTRGAIGYLLSQYPAINHTHLMREVEGLRSHGIHPYIISVRKPDRAHEQLSPEEREEVAGTRYLKGAGLGAMARAHVATFTRNPALYFRTFSQAIGLGRGLTGALWHGFYFAEAVIAGQWFLERGVTHVHTHFVSTVALLIGRLFPITFSSSIHGSEEFEVPGYHIDKKVAEGLFTRVISYYGKSQVLKASSPRDWHKVEVCRLGVNTSIYEPQPVHGSECFRVVTVGRAVEAKGHRLVIHAVARLIHEGRPIELVVAGGGPDLESLKGYASELGVADRVIFTGFIHQDRLRALYNTAHCFVLASFAEGVPTVLIEAMAMGVAAVSTWITGVPEVIRHRLNGLLIPPASEEAIAEAITTLMDDPELGARIAVAGREKILEEFDLAKTGGRMARLLQACLDQEKRPAG